MKSLRTLSLAALVCSFVAFPAVLATQTIKPAKPAGTPPKAAYYVDVSILNAETLIPEPPAEGSPQDNAELAELHRIEATRTPEQVAKAKSDEENEDMFAFKSTIGDGFTAEALPATAALGVHVKNEQSAVGAALKLVFHKARPYQTDKTLHPVCAITEAPNSYPSGHALTGYLEAFTLAELMPERRVAILARADDYAHNRLICGVHHPSDIEASRRAAYVTFGYMLATPKFERDLEAAREELRAKGLAAK